MIDQEPTRRYVVFHRWYGCETGCCGHAVALVAPDEEPDPDDNEVSDSFDFAHAYDGDPQQFARELLVRALGREHTADLDWEHSIVLDGMGC